MWAGGSFHWKGTDPRQSAVEGGWKTDVIMLLVGVEKEFRDSKGDLCVLDRRILIFRLALDLTKSVSSVPRSPDLSREQLDKAAEGHAIREYNCDEVALF